jgi:outer membrane immunogenic protein
MKNFSLSIVAAMIVITGIVNKASAQSDKVHFGVKAGLSLMTLGSATGSGVTADFSYKPGLQAGIFYDIPLSNDVIFSPQLLYTQKGGEVNNGDIFGVKYSSTIKIDYLDIPLLFAYKAAPKFRIYAGPQVSLLLSQKSSITVNGQTTVNSQKSMFKSTLVGANLGLGYDITDIFNINANYVIDLSHTGKKQYDEGERNSGFIFTLGARF